MKRILFVLALVLGLSAVMYSQNACSLGAVISVAAGTTGQLVTAVPARTLYVCGFSITGNTAATGAQFQTGSGTLCGTNNVNKTGVMLMAANGSISHGSGNGYIFSGEPGAAVCLAATTGAVTGLLSYETN